MILTMKNKKPNITKPLETIAFVDQGSKSLIITIIGFDDLNVAEEFAKYMLCRSGMDYEPSQDLFRASPTIH